MESILTSLSNHWILTGSFLVCFVLSQIIDIKIIVKTKEK